MYMMKTKDEELYSHDEFYVCTVVNLLRGSKFNHR